MTLNEYQKKAMTTCLPSSKNFSYMMLNLMGEVGEFASKVGKAIRKGRAYIGSQNEVDDNNELIIITENKEQSNIFIDELKKEAGDCLWMLSGLCSIFGWELEEIGQINLNKLAARKAIGTIDGNGDGIIRNK